MLEAEESREVRTAQQLSEAGEAGEAWGPLESDTSLETFDSS